VPFAVHQLRIEKREGGEGVRLWVDSVDGLLGLVEIGVIEIHPWNATVDDYEKPDQIVFDLDPGKNVPYEFVTQTALRLRDLLKTEGLHSWPKLTGGRGIHVVAPAKPDMSHDAARRYCLTMAERLARASPEKYTTRKVPAPNRLFIDYLRNGRGNTAIGAYSPRARKGFPIAAPVTWREIENGIRSDAITMDNIAKHATRPQIAARSKR
jgi:bifunctional non-homologous end joining protein LigD